MSAANLVLGLGAILPHSRFGTCDYGPQNREEKFQELAARLLSLGGPVESSASGYRLWPEGVVGSVSHKAGVLAVATSTSLARLGIDLERVDRLLIPAVDYIMPEGVPSDLPLDVALNLGFSLKEAVFKALATTRCPVVDFSDVRLEFQGSEVVVDTELPLNLAYAIADRWILSAAFWRD